MSESEKRKAVSTVRIRNDRLFSGETMARSRQKGSILIGIIITMVIMSALGVGMIYLTTTSTFQELLANNNARAYYAAESGGRYANSLARNALAYGSPSLGDLTSLFSGNGTTHTMTMANGDTFQIKNWQELGVNSKYFTYDSIGTTGSGFLQARRKLSYVIYPANQGGAAGSLPPAIPPAFSDFEKPAGSASDASWLGTVFSPTQNQDTKVFENPKVDNDYALNLAAASYTMGLKWYNNPEMAQLDKIKRDNGGLLNLLDGRLNYGVQVKIKDIDVDANNASPYSITGISFRLDDNNNNTLTDDLDNMYGISFVKLTKPGNTGNNDPVWYRSYIHENSDWNYFSVNNAGTWFVVLWKRIFTDSSPTYTPLAYEKISSTDSLCRVSTASGCTKLQYWSTIMVYVKDTGTSNEIRGYLSSPPSYLRSTVEAPQTPRWAEIYGEPNPDAISNPSTVLKPFRPISWTVITDSGAVKQTGTLADIIQDSSLTTANYTGYTIGNYAQTKAREIGLHIFNISTSAQNIYYDNLYIDLLPSGYGAGYIDASGQVVQYP